MKKYLQKLLAGATKLNYHNIKSLLEKNSSATFLDLGCDGGAITVELAAIIGTNDIYGVEIVEERAREAENRGIKVSRFDLNRPFEFPDAMFDAVYANQVIEHLFDTDMFLSEIHRVLKPGGYAIVSTENASSWCNIFASIMGWQIFSLTNFSSKASSLGNPFSLHRSEDPNLKSWNHVRIYNIRGLKEYLEVFGFKVQNIKCAGYFPLPSSLANIDKTHGHFMTFKVRKI